MCSALTFCSFLWKSNKSLCMLPWKGWDRREGATNRKMRWREKSSHVKNENFTNCPTVHLLINVLVLPSHHPCYYRSSILFFSLKLPHNLMAYRILFTKTMGTLETKAYWNAWILLLSIASTSKHPSSYKTNLICDCFQALQPNFRIKISWSVYGFVLKGVVVWKQASGEWDDIWPERNSENCISYVCISYRWIARSFAKPKGRIVLHKFLI